MDTQEAVIDANDGSDSNEARSQQQPESSPQRGSTSIHVSNARGYLCHVRTDAEFLSCPPQLIFALFTNPDNTGVFRDIKRVTSRKVIQDDPAGLKVVEIEQLGETWLLWLHVEFRTRLTVTEDSRDPDNLRTQFELISSDVLNKFNGSWHLQPLRQEGNAASLGTLVHLEQDVSPRGVPEFLKHVPVVGNVLKGMCVRAVERLLDDVATAAQRLDSGEPWDEVVRGSSARVQSHMLDDFSDSGSASPSESEDEEQAVIHAADPAADPAPDKDAADQTATGEGRESCSASQRQLGNAVAAITLGSTADVNSDMPKPALNDSNIDDASKPSTDISRTVVLT